MRQTVSKPHQPRVSVLLPVHNGDKTLGAALDSLTQQTETSLQIIVIDDGSTDTTSRLIKEHAGRDPRIHLLTQHHKGIVASLNAGLACATGVYIARMDADDLCDYRRMDLQATHLDQNPDIGVVSCLVEHVDLIGEANGYGRHVAWLNQLITPSDIWSQQFIDAPVAHPSVMIRRELFETHGVYKQGPFPEDYELWLRWLHHGVRFGKINAPLLKWTDHPDRISRTDPRCTEQAFWAIKCEWLIAALEAKPPHELWIAPSTSTCRSRLRPVLARFPPHAFLDADTRRHHTGLDRPQVLPPDALPPPGPNRFLLAVLGKRGERERLDGWLKSRGWFPGEHYFQLR